jgi:hypothetical protein
MAFALESAARAALLSSPTAPAEVGKLLQKLYWLTLDQPADVNSALEGLVRMFLAMMDHWAGKLLGVSFSADIAMGAELRMRYKNIAVPLAKATIAKKRVLTSEEIEMVLDSTPLRRAEQRNDVAAVRALVAAEGTKSKSTKNNNKKNKKKKENAKKR